MRVKIPYDNATDKFNFDTFDMENSEIDFHSILTKLKGGKTQLIIELTGIWLAGGKYGCTWKVVSGKFQLSQNNRPKFIEDSDTEKVNDEEEEEEEDVSITADLADVKVGNSDDEETPENPEEEVKEEEPAAKGAARGRKTTKK
jgi:hypothetical protein